MEKNGSLGVTERSKLRRRPQRGCQERDVVNGILDEALVCHIGLVEDGLPVVIPATPWRVDEWLYLHGAAQSRLIRHIASGAQISVSVALVDGLVLARSAMRHSCDYRSVVLFGKGEVVDGQEQKAAALLKLIEKLSPGRSSLVRPPNDSELAATGVVRLLIAEGGAKIRSGPPTEAEQDAGWTVWAGNLPLAMQAGRPLPAPGNEANSPPKVPAWLAGN